jgi:hypothetical protein
MVEDKIQGNVRMRYEINGESLEITCLVCGTYSAGTEVAKKFGNGIKMRPELLQTNPYICACGTKYTTKFSEDHWHLFVNIPKELINKESLNAKLITAKNLENASKDDLLAIIDGCEALSVSLHHHEGTGKSLASLEKYRTDAAEQLKTRFGLDDKGIRSAWQEWNDRTLRQEYDSSYCAKSKCEDSPGFDHYKQLGGTLCCGSAMIYDIPKTEEDCRRLNGVGKK